MRSVYFAVALIFSFDRLVLRRIVARDRDRLIRFSLP